MHRPQPNRKRVSHIDLRKIKKRQSSIRTKTHHHNTQSTIEFLKRRIIEGIKLKMNQRKSITHRTTFLIHCQYSYFTSLTKSLRTYHVDRKPQNVNMEDIRVIYTPYKFFRTFGVHLVEKHTKKSNMRYVLKTSFIEI